MNLDYVYPERLIAQAPLKDRDGARLLVVDRKRRAIEHSRVRAIAEAVPPALWILNDTKVIQARLHCEKPTGGKVELLLLEPRNVDERNAWQALGRPAKSLRAGQQLRCGDLVITVIDPAQNGQPLLVDLHTEDNTSIDDALEASGAIPLPPYITRKPSVADAERYQTVFSKEKGAVAAPTAGLHFSSALLDSMRSRGHDFAHITLHVGAGTFAPIRNGFESHTMHEERYHVPEETVHAIQQAKKLGRRVVAVGTTAVRALESSVDKQGRLVPTAGSYARTSLFIRPPYQFNIVDTLFTNFHQPNTTLLALIMTFADEELIRSAYQTAIEDEYRLFSYGDAMLIK